jgi:polysaccharide pyruvyl transferase WcaK-like protein
MIHHVFANKTNIGDWLSARGIQKLLAPAHVVEHLCDEPFVDQTLSKLQRTSTRDLIVIGGGGLFMDYFAPFWTGLRELKPPASLCIWGVGYCDLKAEPSHPPLDVVREIVQASLICVVRDNLTRNYLGADVVGPPIPCPSMVAVRPEPGGWGVLHVDNYTTVGASAFDVMDTVSREFAHTTSRPYRRTNNKINTAVELDRVLSLYAASDVVVSSALHGCIIAVAMGKVVCAVSGDRKIEAFMNAAGLGDWVVDMRDVASLSNLLLDLPSQSCTPGFVDAAISMNIEVAEKIKAICQAHPVAPTAADSDEVL